jgi:hypothetical protein
MQVPVQTIRLMRARITPFCTGRAQKMFVRLLSAIFLVLATSYVAAQSETVERTAQGESGKDIQVGIYVNIQSNCTSGPLPTIRLTQPPEHGKVTVKKAKINITNYKQCLALDGAGYVALYRSDKNFSGTDTAVLEVSYPGGKQEVQHIVITIRSAGAQQPI